jgi:hypothetical protein
MFAPSPACVYRVIPPGPTRNVPREAELAVLTITARAAPGIAGLAAMLVAGDPPVEEHAANSRLEARTRAAICRTAGIWISTGGAGTASVLTTSVRAGIASGFAGP